MITSKASPLVLLVYVTYCLVVLVLVFSSITNSILPGTGYIQPKGIDINICRDLSCNVVGHLKLFLCVYVAKKKELVDLLCFDCVI